MPVKEKFTNKKTYSVTLNQEQIEGLRNDNPNLNLSNLIDNLIRQERERIRRKNSYPFRDLPDDFGISFSTPEEEAEFDRLTGLDEIEKQWEEYNNKA